MKSVGLTYPGQRYASASGKDKVNVPRFFLFYNNFTTLFVRDDRRKLRLIMLKEFPSHHSYLTNVFNLANLVLNRDELEIRKLFPNKDIRVINEIKKGSKEKLMEIRLDKATLSCAFRQSKICEESYIFLDSPTELYDYIDFCTSEFPYSDLVDIWNLRNCELQINEMDKEFIFTLKPVGKKVYN